MPVFEFNRPRGGRIAIQAKDIGEANRKFDEWNKHHERAREIYSSGPTTERMRRSHEEHSRRFAEQQRDLRSGRWK